jgi:hypothetical protein
VNVGQHSRAALSACLDHLAYRGQRASAGDPPVPACPLPSQAVRTAALLPSLGKRLCTRTTAASIALTVALVLGPGAVARCEDLSSFGSFYLDALQARSCLATNVGCGAMTWFTLGFIGGVSQPMKLACGLMQHGEIEDPELATALGGTPAELIDAVIAFGSTHPELAKADAGSGVTIALAKHRPCPASKRDAWPSIK